MISGKAVLLAATRENDAFQIDVIPMESGKVYNIPQGMWFNTVAMKDREGWYRFTRQIKVERDGDFWEITSVGTGGVSCGE